MNDSFLNILKKDQFSLTPELGSWQTWAPHTGTTSSWCWRKSSRYTCREACCVAAVSSGWRRLQTGQRQGSGWQTPGTESPWSVHSHPQSLCTPEPYNKLIEITQHFIIFRPNFKTYFRLLNIYLIGFVFLLREILTSKINSHNNLHFIFPLEAL